MRTRQWTWLGTLGVVSVLAAGCGGHRSVEISPYQGVAVGQRWNAVLSTPSRLAGVAQVRGEGWMGPADDAGRTAAEVRIENASPGGEHPWRINRGRCGESLGILGNPDSYDALKVGGDGNASQKATLDVPLPTTGEYSLAVYASKSNMGTVVACGNLAPPNR